MLLADFKACDVEEVEIVLLPPAAKAAALREDQSDEAAKAAARALAYSESIRGAYPGLLVNAKRCGLNP